MAHKIKRWQPGDKVPLRIQLLWVSFEALRKTRRKVKGVRQSFLWCVGLIGFQEGASLTELSKIANLNVKTLSSRFVRIINDKAADLIWRKRGRYFLTEKGRLAFNSINEEMDEILNKLIKEMEQEVRKRL